MIDVPIYDDQQVFMQHQTDIPELMPEPLLDIQQDKQLPSEETLIEQRTVTGVQKTIEKATVRQDIAESDDLYEKIVLEGIRSANEQENVPLLQDILAEADLTPKCKQLTKPRRALAIKLFSATLSKCLKLINYLNLVPI